MVLSANQQTYNVTVGVGKVLTMIKLHTKVVLGHRKVLSKTSQNIADFLFIVFVKSWLH